MVRSVLIPNTLLSLRLCEKMKTLSQQTALGGRDLSFKQLPMMISLGISRLFHAFFFSFCAFFKKN